MKIGSAGLCASDTWCQPAVQNSNFSGSRGSFVSPSYFRAFGSISQEKRKYRKNENKGVDWKRSKIHRTVL